MIAGNRYSSGAGLLLRPRGCIPHTATGATGAIIQRYGVQRLQRYQFRRGAVPGLQGAVIGCSDRGRVFWGVVKRCPVIVSRVCLYNYLIV